MVGEIISGHYTTPNKRNIYIQHKMHFCVRSSIIFFSQEGSRFKDDRRDYGRKESNFLRANLSSILAFKAMKIAFLKINKILYESINFLSIISYLKSKVDNIEVKLIDAKFDDIHKEITAYKPDVLAISAMTPEYEEAKHIAREVRKRLSCFIVIGGVHITMLPESFDKCFDVGVLGEGELPFTKLIINKLDKTTVHSGIVYFEGETLLIKPQTEYIENLDDIPMVDRSILDHRYYEETRHHSLAKYTRYATIITSRGCPYRCRFCITTRIVPKVRYNSAERVAQEIKSLYENYNIECIGVLDDLFSVKKDRLIRIIELLEEYKILGKIKFNVQIRANTVDEDYFKIFKRMNVYTCSMGFETGSDRLLEYLKGKGITVEQNYKAMRLCKKYHIKAGASFMIGVPTETREDIELTYKAIKQSIKLGASNIFCSVMIPYPGSEFYNLLNRKDLDFSEFMLYREKPYFLNIPEKEFFRIKKKIDRTLFFLNNKSVLLLTISSPIKSAKYYLKRLAEMRTYQNW